MLLVAKGEWEAGRFQCNKVTALEPQQTAKSIRRIPWGTSCCGGRGESGIGQQSPVFKGSALWCRGREVNAWCLAAVSQASLGLALLNFQFAQWSR